MEEKMNIYYDEKGDFLEITMGDISNCYFDNLGNGLFRLVDKDNGKIVGISIHNFKKRTSSLETLQVQLPFKFEIMP